MTRIKSEWDYYKTTQKRGHDSISDKYRSKNNRGINKMVNYHKADLPNTNRVAEDPSLALLKANITSVEITESLLSEAVLSSPEQSSSSESSVGVASIAETESSIDLSEKYPGINPDYQYLEPDIELIIQSALKDQLGLAKRGIIKKGAASFTVGYDLAIGGVEQFSSTFKIQSLNEAIIAFAAQQATLGPKHTFLLPIHIHDRGHWVLGRVIVEFKQDDIAKCNIIQIGVSIYDAHMSSKTKDNAENIGIVRREFNGVLLPIFYKNLLKFGPAYTSDFTYLMAKQQKRFCCGDIVIEEILQLLDGREIPTYADFSVAPMYKLDEIMRMRKAQIECIEAADQVKGAEFRAKQLANKIGHVDKAPELDSKLVDNIAQELYNLVRDNKEFLDKAHELCEEEYQLHTEFFLGKYSSPAKNGVQPLPYIKSWFANNWDKLEKSRGNFFKLRQGEAELSWCDGGRDFLVKVLDKVLSLKDAAEVQQMSAVHSRYAPAKVAVSAPLADGFFNFSGDARVCENTGYYMADGYGQEQYRTKFLDYKYVGIYREGNPTLGKLNVISYGLNITFSFDGELGNNPVCRDKNPSCMKGNIHCIVGPALLFDGSSGSIEKAFVTYRGYLENFIPTGHGLISYVGADADRSIEVQILDGVCCIVKNSNSKDFGSLILNHFQQYKSDLRLVEEDPYLIKNATVTRTDVIAKYTAQNIERYDAYANSNANSNWRMQEENLYGPQPIAEALGEETKVDNEFHIKSAAIATVEADNRDRTGSTYDHPDAALFNHDDVEDVSGPKPSYDPDAEYYSDANEYHGRRLRF